MASGIRKKRKLLTSLLVAASCCQHAACSDGHLRHAAVDEDGNGGSSSSALHHEKVPVAKHDDAKNKRSMEMVASAVRSLNGSSSSSRAEAEAEDDPAFHFQRSRRKATRHEQQQQQQKQRRNDDVTNNNNIDNAERDLIVGGTVASPGRFPYAVSLQLEQVLDEVSAENGDGGEGAEVRDVHTCGGTLIAMDVVLTAGHCGYEELPSAIISGSGSTTGSDGGGGDGNKQPEEEQHLNFGTMPQQIFYGADVGAYDLDSNDGGGYTVENMLFEKLVLHPDYTGFHGKGNSRMSLQHDVMLVKLYGASDQPVVRLHNPELVEEQPERHRDMTDGEELVVIGWGDTDPVSGEESTALASTLQAATVNYVPNDVCENSKGYSNIQSSSSAASSGGTEPKFEDYFEYDGTISEDMMCASGKSRQDACQGDSGGGLFRLGEDFDGDDDVQMGIVSWGLQCGDEDFPGVYSRVGDHYDWIAKQVCELSDSPPASFQCPTKPYPPGSPFDPVVDLTITIRFDDYRSETAWVLESIPDFRNIVFRQFGTYKPKESVDENNAMTETVPVHSGRFYMLSILDEFADGFCCTVGEGYFRVDSASSDYPVVETTPGILWTPHALRRAFYVGPPPSSGDASDDDYISAQPRPDYVTISVMLGPGGDPGKFLLVALENVAHEALMLYEIRPFVVMNDSRNSAGGESAVYSRVFRVPVFGVEFQRQRYNVMIYDDNEGEGAKASFEVYLGDAHPDNLILSQSGNYGDENNISRSFVLFKKQKEAPTDPPAFVRPVETDVGNGANMNSRRSIVHTLMCLLLVASFGN